MSLRLITGAAGAGRGGVINAELVDRAGRGCTSTLLVPAAPDVSRALRQLAAHAPVGLDISTFDNLLDRLWNVQGDGRRIVTPA